MAIINIDIDNYLSDPRSRFAIWCRGEGWCPAFGTVKVYDTFQQALVALQEWQEENPTSKYEIREVI